MKTAVIIVRVLVGLLLVFSSIVVLFDLVPTPELTGRVKTFQDGLEASGYLIPFIKITELICGILFISGRFVALANVIIFPVVLNIFLFHVFLASEGLPVAIFLLFAILFLAYASRNPYKNLFVAK